MGALRRRAASASAAAKAAPASDRCGVRTLASLARSVKAVPINIISVGKGNSKGAELMAAEWADKLRR